MGRGSGEQANAFWVLAVGGRRSKEREMTVVMRNRGLATPCVANTKCAASVLLRRGTRKQAQEKKRRLTNTVAAQAKQQDEEMVVEEGSPEKTTEKFGLEVGLFKTLTDKSKDGTERKVSAKGLLAKYGSAYLLTSISFAIVSFALCYFLVSVGIDVSTLLGKLGLHISKSSEKVGRFAIAYAAHKAASPIRFPPTVALTPVVAQLMGKKGEEAAEEDEQ